MVSVIIPYYNAENWIEKTINSCLQQEYLKEIIVVNDHSPDNGAAVIKKLEEANPGKIKLYDNPGKGGNLARNHGFAQATGEYIQWLDADDTILPGKFTAQVNALKGSSADVCYSDWRMDSYDKDGNLLKEEYKNYVQYNDFCEELLKDNWTSPNNYLLTYKAAKLIDENNGWNPKRKIAQDREYFTVGALLGLKFIYTQGTFAVYNLWNSNSVSRMKFMKRLELTQDLEKRFYKIINAFEDKHKAKKYKRIIYTHHLKAIFYNPSIKLSYRFSLFDIKWNMMHWKMRLVMPFIYFRSRYLKV